VENSVFSGSTRAVPEAPIGKVQPTFAVDGLLRSGGNNFVEGDHVESFGLGAALSDSSTEVLVPDWADPPATPFVMTIGHIEQRKWVSESVLVTSVSAVPEQRSKRLTIQRDQAGSGALAHPIGSVLAWSRGGFLHPTDRVGIGDSEVILVMSTDIVAANGISANDLTLSVADPTRLPAIPFDARIVSQSGTTLQSAENVLVTAVDGYQLTIERAKAGTTEQTHSAGAKLEFYERVSPRTSAALAGSGIVSSDTPFASPLPGSPLIDQGDNTSFKAFSGEIASGLAADFQTRADVHFAVSPAAQPIEFAEYVFFDQEQLPLTDTAGLPAAPFVLLVGDELMDVVAVDTINHTVDVVRGA
ncbi:MAG: hypothetical protein MI861_07630, partial [Pirellulales bacterium]|nr:hypothetical protein [Pirellulales bacterium]